MKILFFDKIRFMYIQHTPEKKSILYKREKEL